MQHRLKTTTLVMACMISLLTCLPSWGGFLDVPKVEDVRLPEDETLLHDIDIPTVRDRDPDPTAGPRLNVSEFRIQGIIEFPELGITRAGLLEQVESIRFNLMAEGQQLSSGFTLKELGAISSLLVDIESKTKDRHVTTLELQQMVFLMRGQLRERGITLGMLDTVADTVTNYYRERGFVLAKAFIPEQKVRDGVVSLSLLLGELSDVKVDNVKRYSADMLTKVFASSIYQPVTSEQVEENLYLINDFPGLNVRGYFEPGKQVGDTALHINVISEKRFSGNVRVDNHGSLSTGEYRAYADVFIYNPLGWSDQIQLGLLNSFDPDNTTYGLLRYDSYILGPQWRLSTGVSSNDFISSAIITERVVESKGESVVADASIKRIFKRSRKKNLSLDLTLTHIATKLDISGSKLPDATVQNLTLKYNFDALREKNSTLHMGSLGLVFSESVETAGEVGSVKEDYTRLVFDYAMLKFVNFPFTNAKTRLLTEVSGQYAGERQQPVNQFALSGPTRTRGFDVSRFFSDDGLRLGVEWVFKFPDVLSFSVLGEKFSDVIQPYLLADISYGKSHAFEGIASGSTDSIEASFGNVGLGFKFNFKHTWKGDLSFGLPVLEDVDGQEDEGGGNAFFSLQYSY